MKKKQLRERLGEALLDADSLRDKLYRSQETFTTAYHRIGDACDDRTMRLVEVHREAARAHLCAAGSLESVRRFEAELRELTRMFELPEECIGKKGTSFQC